MTDIFKESNDLESIFSLEQRETTGDGIFKAGENAEKIFTSKDKKEEYIFLSNGRVLVSIISNICPATYYEFLPNKIQTPIKAVLMDLDGTSVMSEKFWIELVRLTVSVALKNKKFLFHNEDLPFISGHSVSEHLIYCKNKFKLKEDLNDLIVIYYNYFESFLNMKNDNCIKQFFHPRDNLKAFLLSLKKNNIKVGLVTSGTIEKAMVEIEVAFKIMGFKETPDSFYDRIITAGNSVNKNICGTLGELVAKPHPWLYRETAFVGLGIDFSERNQVVCIEDSAAGVMSSRLAGFPTIGITGGNIKRSGCEKFCQYFVEDLMELLGILNIKNGGE